MPYLLTIICKSLYVLNNVGSKDTDAYLNSSARAILALCNMLIKWSVLIPTNICKHTSLIYNIFNFKPGVDPTKLWVSSFSYFCC